MEVTNIVYPTYSKEQAERENEHFRWRGWSLVKHEGDIDIPYETDINGIIYKKACLDRDFDYKNKEAVESQLDRVQRRFKREYHWLLTCDQEGTYMLQRSAKQLNTLQRQYPDRFPTDN